MFSSFSEATLYLQNNLNIFDPNNPFDEEEVREVLFDRVFMKIDDTVLDTCLSDTDKKMLDNSNGDEKLVLSILASRVPNFYTLLTDTVAELLHEYMSDDGDDDDSAI